MERLLPIGTIVQARWTDQHAVRMMIVGYYPKNKNTGKIYDYMAVFYPMGMSFSDAPQGLNRGAILKVEAMGFEDERTREYLQGMEQILQAAKERMSQNDEGVKE